MITRLRKASRLQLLPLVLGFALLAAHYRRAVVPDREPARRKCRHSRTRSSASSRILNAAEPDAGRRDQPARLSADRRRSPISNPIGRRSTACRRTVGRSARGSGAQRPAQGPRRCARRGDQGQARRTGGRDRPLRQPTRSPDALDDRARRPRQAGHGPGARRDHACCSATRTRSWPTAWRSAETHRTAPAARLHPGACRRASRWRSTASSQHGACCSTLSAAQSSLNETNVALRQEIDTRRSGRGAGAPDAEDGGGRPADGRHRA